MEGHIFHSVTILQFIKLYPQHRLGSICKFWETEACNNAGQFVCLAYAWCALNDNVFLVAQQLYKFLIILIICSVFLTADTTVCIGRKLRV